MYGIGPSIQRRSQKHQHEIGPPGNEKTYPTKTGGKPEKHRLKKEGAGKSYLQVVVSKLERRKLNSNCDGEIRSDLPVTDLPQQLCVVCLKGFAFLPRLLAQEANSF